MEINELRQFVNSISQDKETTDYLLSIIECLVNESTLTCDMSELKTKINLEISNNDDKSTWKSKILNLFS